jgi:hypothetical protein
MITMKYFMYVIFLSAWATHGWASDDETLEDTQHIIQMQNQSYSESLYRDAVVKTPEYETCLDLLRTINADKTRLEKYGENPNLIEKITKNQRVLGETLQQLMSIYHNYRTECNNQNLPVIAFLYDNPELQSIITEFSESIIRSIVPADDDRTESLDDSPAVTVLSDFDLLYMISQYLNGEDLIALDLTSHQTHFYIRTLIADNMKRFARSLNPSHSALSQDRFWNMIPSTFYFQNIVNEVVSVVLYTNPYVQFHKKLPASLTTEYLPELRIIELNDLNKILACLLPYTIYVTGIEPDEEDTVKTYQNIKKDLSVLKQEHTYTFFSDIKDQEVNVEGIHYIIMTETEFLSAENREELIQYLVYDPDAYLLLDLENEIPPNFKPFYFHSIKNIILLNTQNNLTQVGYQFLFGCNHLQTVDFSGLYNLTQIGDRFLSGCDRLQTLDLSPLYKLTQIGDSFLTFPNGCGDNFLSECTGIQTLDLSPLYNLTQIGDGFLARCTGLQTVDLSGLYNLTQIGKNFLSECTSLQTLDLSPLYNLTQIGDHFLWKCSGLKAVNLSPLSNVTHIGGGFLFGCTGLQTVDLSGLSNLTQIGNHFLQNCTGLQEIDLSPFHNVTQIGYLFLLGCTGLQEIDLSPFHNVTQIGAGFLTGCTELINITVANEEQKNLFSAKIPQDILSQVTWTILDNEGL